MRILFFIATLFFSLQVSAVQLNKFVVFGDSLSDSGNLYEYMKHQLPVSPPYYEGRFTNGPVWVELLNELYYPKGDTEHLLNYAFGGAGVVFPSEDDDDDSFFTLNTEIDSYLLAHQDKADPNSVFIVWMGSNNYLGIPDNVDEAVHNVNAGIVIGLKHLVEKGAKHIMVINLPDLGKTPAARDFEAEDVLSEATTKNNLLLEQNVSALKETYPDVQWLFFDVNSLLTDVLQQPGTYGFTNVKDTCYEELFDNPSSKSILAMVSTIKPRLGHDACDGYLFFDPVHPSAPAHVLMANKIKELFEQSGIVFG